MISDSGRTVSVWMGSVDGSRREPLREDLLADVCIIGAGIAGLSVAYTLTQRGASVIVLDDGPMAGGETGRTTAHLSNAFDDRYIEVERLHGQEAARLVADSHTAAIDQIERIVRDEGIDCDFVRLDGYLVVPRGQSRDVLDRELDAAHRAGLREVERVPRAPLDSFDTGPCLRFPRQGQFHPLKYLLGLVRAIESRGGRIFTGTHARSIKGGSPARVTTSDGHTVECGNIVVATNTPVNDMFAIHTKQAPYRTYVVGVRVPRGSVYRALYWDTLDPYHYVRLQTGEEADYDVLIIGGEDHKTGQANDGEARLARLEAWGRERFPMVQEVEFRWSGQVIEPIDYLAFIGINPGDKPNVFIATGDSGQGMTHGTIAGMLLPDLIANRHNPWAKIYDPARKTLSAARGFASENLNVARQYTDYVTPGQINSADDLRPGEGAVLRQGLHKVACYCDDAGQVHQFSAVCPHMGCIVHWNSLEKSWDCPCHGSRFDATGRVVNGPAMSDLSATKQGQQQPSQQRLPEAQPAQRQPVR